MTVLFRPWERLREETGVLPRVLPEQQMTRFDINAKDYFQVHWFCFSTWELIMPSHDATSDTVCSTHAYAWSQFLSGVEQVTPGQRHTAGQTEGKLHLVIPISELSVAGGSCSAFAVFQGHRSLNANALFYTVDFIQSSFLAL